MLCCALSEDQILSSAQRKFLQNHLASVPCRTVWCSRPEAGVGQGCPGWRPGSAQAPFTHQPSAGGSQFSSSSGTPQYWLFSGGRAVLSKQTQMITAVSKRNQELPKGETQSDNWRVSVMKLSCPQNGSVSRNIDMYHPPHQWCPCFVGFSVHRHAWLN
jgi:hypothetical protein